MKFGYLELSQEAKPLFEEYISTIHRLRSGLVSGQGSAVAAYDRDRKQAHLRLLAALGCENLETDSMNCPLRRHRFCYKQQLAELIEDLLEENDSYEGRADSGR